jgi:hypothetical protein
MKKFICFSFSFLFILMLLVLAGCSSTSITNVQKDVFSMREIILEVENAESIEIRNGKTGEVVKLTQRDKIKELLNLLEERIIKKHKSQDEIKGFGYSVSFISENTSKTILLSGKTLKWKNIYYELDSELSSDLKTYFF